MHLLGHCSCQLTRDTKVSQLDISLGGHENVGSYKISPECGNYKEADL